jgi:DNA-binding response OmpR family regulator
MKKVLLIEDDMFLVEIYKKKFEEGGFLFEAAPDGDEGLRKLKDNKPDILLLDIVLPNFDGWEIIRKIKKDEQLKNLKTVILSNLGQKSEVKKGIELGAAKYLIKAHYTPTEVVEEVKKIID